MCISLMRLFLCEKQLNNLMHIFFFFQSVKLTQFQINDDINQMLLSTVNMSCMQSINCIRPNTCVYCMIYRHFRLVLFLLYVSVLDYDIQIRVELENLKLLGNIFTLPPNNCLFVWKISVVVDSSRCTSSERCYLSSCCFQLLMQDQ